MPLHKNLSGAELHYPLGRSSEGSLLLEDDLANSYQIKLGSDNQFNISTVNSAEEITFGNGVQNPKFTFTGTGLFSSGGGHKYALTSLEGLGSGHDMDSSSFVVLVDTSSGTESYELLTPATVPNQLFLIIDEKNTFGTNNLTLTRKLPGDKIDYAASDKVISDDGARIWLFCDGTDWYTFIDGASSGGGGATAITVESKSTTTALTGTNKLIKADSSGGSITLTLPAAATAGAGAFFIIKDIGNAGTNSIVLEGNASETIDGALNLTLAANYASAEVVCDASNWWVR